MKIKKSQFKQMIKEMVVKEISRAQEKRTQQLSKLQDKPGTISNWMKDLKVAREVSATGGNFERLKNMVDSARAKKQLKMSDNFYNSMMMNLQKKPNDTKRLYYLYSVDMKGKGLGTGATF